MSHGRGIIFIVIYFQLNEKTSFVLCVLIKAEYSFKAREKSSYVL